MIVPLYSLNCTTKEVGTDAKVPTNMIFSRFLTLFKGGEKFYGDNAAAIKADMSKA